MMRDIFSQALKQIWRGRRITFIVIATVAAATAAATVLIAAIGAALTVRIPLVGIDTLVEASRKYQSLPMSLPAWSYPTVADLIAGAKHSKFAGWTGFTKTLDTRAGPHYTRFEAVTTSYADVIGVHPDVGRWFTDDENRVPLRDDVVVISHELCRKRADRPDRCIGSLIRVGSADLVVIGVMPNGFKGLRKVGDVDAWTPIMLAPLAFPEREDPSIYLTNPRGTFVGLIGRLKSLNDLPAAQVELTQLARDSAIKRGAATLSTPESDWPQFNLISTKEARTDPIVIRAGRIINAAVAVLLLMTCGNATLLLVAQAYARSRQIAIQMALGASASRVLAGLAAETAFIGIGAVTAGFVLSAGAVALLTTLAGRMQELRLAGFSFSVDSLNAGLRGGALAVSIGTVAALVVALLATWRVLSHGLSAGSSAIARRLAGSLRMRRWQGWIVANQICCAVALTVASGLLVSSYLHAVNGELGFRVSEDLLSVRPSSSPGDLSDAESKAITAAVSSSGGVQAVARVACLPLSSRCVGVGLSAGGPAWTGSRLAASAVLNRVDPGALNLLGIVVRTGRDFNSKDSERVENVAILSRSAAAMLGMAQAPIGQSVTIAGFGEASVVGVVDDVKYDGLTERAKPTVYVPWVQYHQATLELLVARTEVAASSVVSTVRARLEGVRRDLATSEIMPFTETLREISMEQRLQMLLLLAFAAIGIGISAAGILGVTSFTVNLGIQEIGLRLALGATPASVVGLVSARVGKFVAGGVAAGLLLSIATHSLWRPLLYRVDPLDPGILFLCTTLTAAVAAANILWIARRAAAVDPAITLRAE